jgi:hypothetical protein
MLVGISVNEIFELEVVGTIDRNMFVNVSSAPHFQTLLGVWHLRAADSFERNEDAFEAGEQVLPAPSACA